jgi:hypothetical protein
MGYFPNGSAGDDYQHHYCERCVNDGDPDNLDEPGCWIWLQHMLHNYEECNSRDSMLHKLIPRDARGINGQCVMFKRVQD